MRDLRSKATGFVRERLVRPLLPDSVATHVNRNDRVGALYRAWGYIFTNRMEGAYYEFGVYRGSSFRASYQAYQFFQQWLEGQLSSAEPWRQEVSAPFARAQHSFYAFDTFQGMPENGEENAVFAAGNFLCSLEEFSRLNAEASVREGATVRYFRGTFDSIYQRRADEIQALQPAAIANIDCDLYASTRDALKILASKLRQGSVLLMDDWNGFYAQSSKGGRRALKEFSERRPEFSFEPWFAYEFVGQAFLVHMAT